MSKASKYMSLVVDEMPNVHKHADGSICKAKTPDACPFNKKAEQGDSNLGGCI